jgi:hypothetical protein
MLVEQNISGYSLRVAAETTSEILRFAQNDSLSTGTNSLGNVAV